jgi:hypothetical protein
LELFKETLAKQRRGNHTGDSGVPLVSHHSPKIGEQVIDQDYLNMEIAKWLMNV